jgi:hypothetical protein
VATLARMEIGNLDNRVVVLDFQDMLGYAEQPAKSEASEEKEEDR